MPSEHLLRVPTVEDWRRLRSAGACAGDGLVLGYASGEDAGLQHNERQRQWVETLLPRVDGVHAVIESGPREILVACAAGAVSAVLATLLEQGFVGVGMLADAFPEGCPD